MDEKIAIMDTVDKRKQTEFLEIWKPHWLEEPRIIW